MKLPAAIKISRGAKNTDPAHVREQAEEEFEYVTRCIFRGSKRQERFAVPGQRNAQPRATTAESLGCISQNRSGLSLASGPNRSALA